MDKPTEKTIDPVYAYVGARLRELRLQQGIKQAALAQLIGVSSQQYYKYEDAQSKCSLTNLLKLSNALGVELSAILPVSNDEYERARHGSAPSAAAMSGPANTQATDAELIARLISGFVSLPRPRLKVQIVELLEEMASQD